MKIGFSKILPAAACIFAACLCHSKELLVDGGFEAPPPGFKFAGFSQNGIWGVDGDAFKTFGGGDARATYMRQDLLNVDVEVSLAFDRPGGHAGLLFNVSEEGGNFGDIRAYEISFSSDFSSVSLWEHGDSVKNIITVPVGAPGGKFRTIHLVTGAYGLHAYLDREEILVLEDFRPKAFGRVGFVSRGAAALFKGLRFSFDGEKKPAVLPIGREAPLISAKWRAYPGSSNARFFHDDSGAFEGGGSQEFSAKDGVAGIVNRKKFKTAAGKPLKGSVALKGKNLAGRVFIRLVNADASKVYAQSEVKGLGGAWRAEEFELLPDESVPDARFAIVLDGSGSVSADSASLRR